MDMCTGYSGNSGTGIRAYAKDWAISKGAKIGGSGGGIGTGGSSGPSAAAAAGAAYMRRKQGAPLLDSIFGVNNG